mmetsp:Transcript_529/g.1369  ORF Transcript_529/g.1369 Transcript_529/m.1369 type:complete len:102 (-) Transcript_529:338-643(-)
MVIFRCCNKVSKAAMCSVQLLVLLPFAYFAGFGFCSKQQALLHSDFLLRGAMVVACPAQLCVVQLALFCCAQPVDKIAFRYERRLVYCYHALSAAQFLCLM